MFLTYLLLKIGLLPYKVHLECIGLTDPVYALNRTFLSCVTNYRDANYAILCPAKLQVPQIFAGSLVSYSPSMRAGETVKICGACDRLPSC